MRLSPSEKQTLVGPLVVGCLLGAFVAFAVFAFASEYELHGAAVPLWQTGVEATLGFLVAATSTVAILGVLPIAIHRLVSGRSGDA